MHFKSLSFLSLFAVLIVTSACTPIGLATTAGAVAGSAAVSEGGIEQAGIDTRIRLEINDLWFKYDTNAFLKLGLTVDQGRVLLTGVVQNPDHRVEAVKLAWQPKGVKQVINEIQVANSEGISGFARDKWISTSLRTKIIFDRDIQSVNYTIDTVKGVVYLMGIAQNQTELNKVIAHARRTSYVKNVVHYVKMVGDEVPVAGQPISRGAPESYQPSPGPQYQPNTQSPQPLVQTYDLPQDSSFGSGGYSGNSDIRQEPLPPPSY
jgi:osmotically-inducible protein OsmY